MVGFTYHKNHKKNMPMPINIENNIVLFTQIN